MGSIIRDKKYPKPTGEPSRPEKVEGSIDMDNVELGNVVKRPSLGEMMIHDDLQDLKDAFVASMKEVVEALRGIEAKLQEKGKSNE